MELEELSKHCPTCRIQVSGIVGDSGTDKKYFLIHSTQFGIWTPQGVWGFYPKGKVAGT